MVQIFISNDKLSSVHFDARNGRSLSLNWQFFTFHDVFVAVSRIRNEILTAVEYELGDEEEKYLLLHLFLL